MPGCRRGQGDGLSIRLQDANISAMDQPTAPRPVKRCPTCGKPAVEGFRPFCSKRCADVDLNRWLKGIYAVPVAEEDGGEADKPEDEAG